MAELSNRVHPVDPLARSRPIRSHASISGPTGRISPSTAYESRRQRVPSSGYVRAPSTRIQAGSGVGVCADAGGASTIGRSTSEPSASPSRTIRGAGRAPCMRGSIGRHPDACPDDALGAPLRRRRLESRIGRGSIEGRPTSAVHPSRVPPERGTRPIPKEATMPSPRVAATPGELLVVPRGHRTCRRRRPRHRRCGRDARARHPRCRVDRDVQRRRGRRRGRPLDRLGGLAAPRLPVGEHPRPLHGPRPRRDRRVHGAGAEPAHPGVRHGRCRDAGGRGPRRGHRHLRARPERAGVHVPATGRVHHERPRGLHRGRLGRARCSSRATTTSSMPRSTAPTPTA